MKTKEQILEEIKNESLASAAIDNRDFNRLADFFPASDWHFLGYAVKEDETAPAPKEWTREIFLDQLKTDLEFAFRKALDQRALSAGAMYRTIKMWMHVLEDDLAETADDYLYYGLPFLKAVAVKYGFDNPIGNDSGTEKKYGEF